jgi:hypothetical protein
LSDALSQYGPWYDITGLSGGTFRYGYAIAGKNVTFQGTVTVQGLVG